MPTKQTFKRLANKFFDSTFSDFTDSLTFTINGSSTYDPITGQYSNSDTSHSISCIRLEYNINQFDGQRIMIGDRRIISRVDTWDSLGLVPRVNSGSINIDGEDYQVINITKDAADALYDFQCRRL